MAPNRSKQQEKTKKNEKSHSVKQTIKKKKFVLRSEQEEVDVEVVSSMQQNIVEKQKNRKCKIAVKPISKNQTEKSLNAKIIKNINASSRFKKDIPLSTRVLRSAHQEIPTTKFDQPKSIVPGDLPVSSKSID